MKPMLETSRENSEPKTKYLLEMDGIVKRFPGVVALDNVSLSIEPGSVHALLGENGAGKSTLMKCLFGIYKCDEGEIRINGEKMDITSSKDAIDYGIAMVHQELNQVPNCTVTENIWLGRFVTKYGFIDKKYMEKSAQEILARYGMNIDAKEKISKLSLSQRQMVEIAKAVSNNAKLIVLDEPTSSLTEDEVEHLFQIIEELRKKGTTFIYISHKLEEIFRITDHITVMRDGRVIDSCATPDTNMDAVVTMMVGRDLQQRFPEKTVAPSDETLMEVSNLSGAYAPTIKDVSFRLYRGEILGVSGLVGSRRTELVETIFGVRKKLSGEIKIKGKTVTLDDPESAIRSNLALVTEERRATGIFPLLSISANTVISHLKSYCTMLGFIKDKNIREDTQRIIDQLSVKTPSQKTKIENLSGGNQQKVILGRWLLNDPDILMLDDPTRGIDVGAKYDIYKLVIDMAENRRKGVIFISSEMPELLGVTDRILVMSNGRLAGIVKTSETNQEELLRLSAKYL